MKFLFVSNDLNAFLAHRLWLAKRLLDLGHTVVVCSGGIELAQVERLDPRITLVTSRLEQHRLDLKTDWGLIRQYISLLRTIQPDVVHTLTIKPNLFMSIGLLWLKRSQPKLPAFVMTFPGLGKIFEPGIGIGRKIRKTLVGLVFKRVSAKLVCKSTFENPRDMKFFVDSGLFAGEQCVAISGAGIDLRQFVPQKKKSELRVILFASRILYEKGIGVFIYAANAVEIGQSNTEFWVAGPIDKTNPDCFDIAEEEKSGRLGRVKYLGAVDVGNMPQLFNKCEVICLPTRLQEGFPRVLIEAAANGLSLIASDQPSIRQIVHPGENGWLIDPFDPISLQQAIQDAIDRPELAKKYGLSSTQIAYGLGVDEDSVFNAFIAIYDACLKLTPKQDGRGVLR